MEEECSSFGLHWDQEEPAAGGGDPASDCGRQGLGATAASYGEEAHFGDCAPLKVWGGSVRGADLKETLPVSE